MNIMPIPNESLDRAMNPDRKEVFKTALYMLIFLTVIGSGLLLALAISSFLEGHLWSAFAYTVGLVLILPLIHVLLSTSIKDNFIRYDTKVVETITNSSTGDASTDAKFLDFLTKEKDVNNLTKPEYDRIMDYLRRS